MPKEHRKKEIISDPREQEAIHREIKDLVEQAKAGSRESAEELLSRFKPLILSTIKRHHTSQNWDDLLQSAALSMMEGIKAYDAQKGIPFPAYIKTKLNFDIYNLCRKERNIISYHITVDKDGLDPLDFIIDTAADPPENIVKKEEIKAIRDALADLEPKHREVIVLHFFKNITLKEIAIKMGISYKTAQRYKARGMERLTELLGKNVSV